MPKATELSDKFKELSVIAEKEEKLFFEHWVKIPNIVDVTSPVGSSEEDNKEIKKIGEVKEYKNPKKTITSAIKTSQEIINRIPDFPNFIDKANYALQLIAEGKLNLVSSNDASLDLEKMKIKTFQNNMIISVLGIVIVVLLVF